jgi:hypothetical protein
VWDWAGPGSSSHTTPRASGDEETGRIDHLRGRPGLPNPAPSIREHVALAPVRLPTQFSRPVPLKGGYWTYFLDLDQVRSILDRFWTWTAARFHSDVTGVVPIETHPPGLHQPVAAFVECALRPSRR